MARTVRVTLLRCGKCGTSVNPFTSHACSGGRKGRTRIRPAVSGTCPRCGKTRGNPLTHTCTVTTDFKRRKAAAGRKAATAARRARESERKRAAAERKRARDAQRRRAAAERAHQAAARRKAATAARRKSADARRKAAAAAKRKPAARPARTQHDYRACTDGSCRRYACLAWKEALAEGYETGYDTGYPKGRDSGWAEGYAAGLAAASR
jgi:phage protein D